MPELPDVQVFKEYLDATSLHQRVRTVHLPGAELLEDVSESTLRRHLKGRELARSRRHGKWLFAALKGDDRWLVLHFGMTGYLRYWTEGDGPEYTKLRLDFEDGGRLAYVNKRKLGKIGLTEDVDAFVDERDLGPDPWATDGFDLRAFREVLDGHTGTIKSTLMNQSVIAGLGNIYVDEILFRTGIHPESKTDALAPAAVKRVYRAMRSVLEVAVEKRADPGALPRGWLVHVREPGADCPRCGGTIRRIQVSGRSTYFCPEHQEKEGSAG